jgi:hypothetical protein
MDPDVALNEIRALVVLYNDDKVGLTGWQITELVEKISGLDEWLTNGGFTPASWMGLNR